MHEKIANDYKFVYQTFSDKQLLGLLETQRQKRRIIGAEVLALMIERGLLSLQDLSKQEKDSYNTYIRFKK